MSYICLHCGHAFEQPEAKHYDLACGTWDEYCPNCGSEDIEEAERCEVCGELFVDDDMIGHVCRECFDKGITQQNAFRYGETDINDVEINGFLAWVYEKDQINRILKEHFMQESETWKRRMVKEYCENSELEFAEFLESEEDK